jgi:hypothetical protein
VTAGSLVAPLTAEPDGTDYQMEEHVPDAHDSYVPPELHDYGSLVDLTNSSGYRGPEDGGNKSGDVAPHHSGPLT